MPGSVIITIDGPAGTGKSTVASMLARRLGLEFLDTGAMYRAAALISIEEGIDPEDGEGLAVAVRRADLHFDWSKDPPAILLRSRDVSRRIRDLDVSENVSIVAKQSALRSVLVEEQRRIAALHPRLVTEGRDQGSVVFPDAHVRFYLDAAPEVRAERRAEQLEQTGQAVDRPSILRGILDRDHLDSTRSDGPLIRPEGAVDVDTGDLSLEEVIDRLEHVVRQRLDGTHLLSEGEGSGGRAP